MNNRTHAEAALEELQAIDIESLPVDVTGSYDQAVASVEALCADLETETIPNQPTEQPKTPETWEEDEWDEQLDAAREKAAIAPTKGILTTKTIDGRDYYYLQWRDGDTVTSQYVGPVDPA
jgi:hypothetical protein